MNISTALRAEVVSRASEIALVACVVTDEHENVSAYACDAEEAATAATRAHNHFAFIKKPRRVKALLRNIH